MPRKHASNAAGHEMPPVASNKPAPTAAMSSNTNVARKNPAAFAKGSHSATADGERGKASVISTDWFVLVLENKPEKIEDEDEEERSQFKQPSSFLPDA